MKTKEAFSELLQSKKVPTNLRSQWAFRFERNKLSKEKIHEALLEHGYNIRIPSKWKSPYDEFVRPTCESFVHLLLTSDVPSTKKKLWKNRLAKCQLSINKVEDILIEYGFDKIQNTIWDNFIEYEETQRLSPGKDIITIQNQDDSVWLEDGIYHNLLKGSTYQDTIEKALKREKLFDQLDDGVRKPIIIDTSGLISQDKEAQAYYSSFERRDKFACMAILANSPQSIYYSNFFKEINGPNIPTKVFHDYEEAKAWCKEYIITAPEDAFELSHTKIWFNHEGIMHMQYQDKVQSYKGAKKDVETAKEIKLEGPPPPIVIDYRATEKMEKKVQDFYLKNPEILNGYSCFAVVCDHPVNDSIVQFYADHDEFTVPTKVFRYYSEALHWAKKHLPNS